MIELVLLVALTFSFAIQAIMMIVIGTSVKQLAGKTTEMMIMFFDEEIKNYRSKKLGE